MGAATTGTPSVGNMGHNLVGSGGECLVKACVLDDARTAPVGVASTVDVTPTGSII
ncbi:hypothetical protein Lesp01_73970 [Lentzea sp. NBRC 102530]|nr:hypothetical protein Lesp01_73970 [Lentzea sp. NBRC 102530]